MGAWSPCKDVRDDATLLGIMQSRRVSTPSTFLCLFPLRVCCADVVARPLQQTAHDGSRGTNEHRALLARVALIMYIYAGAGAVAGPRSFVVVRLARRFDYFPPAPQREREGWWAHSRRIIRHSSWLMATRNYTHAATWMSWRAIWRAHYRSLTPHRDADS